MRPTSRRWRSSRRPTSSPPQRPSAIAEPRDRDLVRLYWPARLRPAFDALFAIDGAMGDVVARATQPALGAIKLAWWRDRLQELDKGEVPAEPRLQAAARELLPRGVPGVDLALLEQGWSTLLDERPDPQCMEARGLRLFLIGSQLLDCPSSEALASAGRLYGLVSASRHGVGNLIDTAGATAQEIAYEAFPRRLRPLTAFAALAARDVRQAPERESEGTPGRAMALMWHRLSGRV